MNSFSNKLLALYIARIWDSAELSDLNFKWSTKNRGRPARDWRPADLRLPPAFLPGVVGLAFGLVGIAETRRFFALGCLRKGEMDERKTESSFGNQNSNLTELIAYLRSERGATRESERGGTTTSLALGTESLSDGLPPFTIGVDRVKSWTQHGSWALRTI